MILRLALSKLQCRAKGLRPNGANEQAWRAKEDNKMKLCLCV